MQKKNDYPGRSSLLLACIIISVCISCTRNTIEFGDVPENNYTRLAYIDTVGVHLSTVFTDSFVTTSPGAYLLGRYKDPYLGVIAARPFFQMDKPSALPDIPTNAIYDSIVLITKPDHYYYGDTSRSQTISVYELSQSIVASYNSQLYNTSNIPVKPVVLGSRTLRIRPVADDSIVIKLNNSKGEELFNKIKQKHTDLNTTDAFLNYFKGISIGMANNDTTAVYGLISGAGSTVIRVHYHTTIPYEQKQYVDFPSLLNSLSFNQVLADRSGTGLVSGIGGITEISSSQTDNYSFSQRNKDCSCFEKKQAFDI